MIIDLKKALSERSEPFLFGAVSFKPTFDVDVKFMSRDGCVLSGVQHAPSKRDAYGVVGMKFISRDG